MQRLDAERKARHFVISGRPGRIRPDQCDGSGKEQQHSADRFLPQDLGESRGLPPRAAAQQSVWHRPDSNDQSDTASRNESSESMADHIADAIGDKTVGAVLP